MPSVKFTLLKMDLKLVHNKEQFDQISSDQQLIIKKNQRQQREKQDENIKTNKSQEDNEKQQLDKIIPKWGYVTDNKLISNKNLSKKDNFSINYHGYHRTVKLNVSNESKDYTLENKDQLKRLFLKYPSVLKNQLIKKLITQNIQKIISTFQQKEWINQDIVKILIDKLFNTQRFNNQIEKKEDIQYLLNPSFISQIQKMFHDIQEHWKKILFQSQNPNDKTVNIKNKSFDTLPKFYKPFKSRLTNHHLSQLKLLQNHYNKKKSIQNSNQNTIDLLLTYQQIQKKKIKQKEQSKSTFKKICFLAEKFNLQKNSPKQSVLLQKYKINKNQIKSQFESLKKFDFNVEKLQFQERIKKRSYIKKVYHYKKSEKDIQYSQKKRQIRLIKKINGWQRDSTILKNYNQIEIYQESLQQKTKQNHQQLMLSSENSTQVYKYKNIKQVLENLNSLITPEQNIYSYIYKEQRKIKIIRQNQNQYNNNETQKTYKKQKIKIISLKSKEEQDLLKKQDNNISVQTCYEQQSDNAQYFHSSAKDSNHI